MGIDAAVLDGLFLVVVFRLLLALFLVAVAVAVAVADVVVLVIVVSSSSSPSRWKAEGGGELGRMLVFDSPPLLRLEPFFLALAILLSQFLFETNEIKRDAKNLLFERNYDYCTSNEW